MRRRRFHAGERLLRGAAGGAATGAAFWRLGPALRPEPSVETAQARGHARAADGWRRGGLGRDRGWDGFCEGAGDGRLELRDGRWRRRRFVADDKRRRHLRCPVMVVRRNDADGGAGRLLGDAFDGAFAAAEIAEGQAFRQAARGQPQPLAAGVDEGRQVRSISGPDNGGRQVDIRLQRPSAAPRQPAFRLSPGGAPGGRFRRRRGLNSRGLGLPGRARFRSGRRWRLRPLLRF